VSYTGAFAGIPTAARRVLATAYVASRAKGSSCGPCAVFETSPGGGQTWSRHLIPAQPSIYSFFLSNPTGPNPPVANQIGNDSQNVWFEPYVAADPSHAGHYAVMLLDKDRTHLLVFVTHNSGASWSGPAPMGDGQPGFRDKPAIAFAPDGSLGVTWKSAYPDRGYSFDVWAAVAPRGDTRFLLPVRLNDATSPAQPCGTGLHGEAYTCDELDWTVLSDSYLYSVWGDGRGGENPWFGRSGYVAVARGRHDHRPHHHRHRRPTNRHRRTRVDRNAPDGAREAPCRASRYWTLAITYRARRLPRSWIEVQYGVGEWRHTTAPRPWCRRAARE
jgi:hypothetical protein